VLYQSSNSSAGGISLPKEQPERRTVTVFPVAYDDLDDPREELTFVVRAKEAVFTVVLTNPSACASLPIKHSTDFHSPVMMDEDPR